MFRMPEPIPDIQGIYAQPASSPYDAVAASPFLNYGQSSGGVGGFLSSPFAFALGSGLSNRAGGGSFGNSFGRAIESNRNYGMDQTQMNMQLAKLQQDALEKQAEVQARRQAAESVLGLGQGGEGKYSSPYTLDPDRREMASLLMNLGQPEQAAKLLFSDATGDFNLSEGQAHYDPFGRQMALLPSMQKLGAGESLYNSRGDQLAQAPQANFKLAPGEAMFSGSGNQLADLPANFTLNPGQTVFNGRGQQLANSPDSYLLSAGQAHYTGGQQDAYLPPEENMKAFTLSAGQGRYDPTGQLIAQQDTTPENYTLAPGAQRYDATNQLVAQAPGAANSSPAIKAMARIDADTVAKSRDAAQQANVMKQLITQYKDILNGTSDAEVGPVVGNFSQTYSGNAQQLQQIGNAIALQAKTVFNMGNQNFSDADRKFVAQIAGGTTADKNSLLKGADRLTELANQKMDFNKQLESTFTKQGNLQGIDLSGYTPPAAPATAATKNGDKAPSKSSGNAINSAVNYIFDWSDGGKLINATSR
jgi:hypothetical protein